MSIEIKRLQDGGRPQQSLWGVGTVTFSRLEIVRYAPTGQVDRRIACLAGRISVFRSRSDQELELYQDALIGKQQDRKEFALVLDENSFDAVNHEFIGFGEAWTHPDPTTVEAYAARRPGASEAIVTGLTKFGFRSLLGARLADLSPLQQRAIRLVSAVAAPGSVVVIREPFDNFPDELREEVGSYLAEQTWKNQLIVIITSLVARPDSWLENEHISRIQLEKPRQRTIGFGSGGFGTVALVDKLRQELRSGSAPGSNDPGSNDVNAFFHAGSSEIRPQRARQNHLTRKQSADDFQRNRSWQKYLALGLGASVFTVGLALSLSPTPPHSVVALTPQALNPGGGVSSAASITPVLPVIPQTSSSAPPPVALALNEYSSEIQDAVRKAFYEPLSELDDVPGFPSRAPQPTPTSAVETPAETSTFDDPQPEPPNEQDLEARREQLREAFRQAIMLAQQRRMMEQQMIMPQ